MSKTTQKLLQSVLTGTTLPSDYHKVVAVVIGLNMQVWFAGMRAGLLRYKVFNQQFMTEQFGKEHQEIVGEPIKMGGFPDNGSGHYSKKLSYKDWLAFNVRQRVHLNAVESIFLTSISLLAAGVYNTQIALACGGVIFLGRFLNAFGVKDDGKQTVLKKVGFQLSLAGTVVAIGTFFAYAFNLIK